MLRFVLFPVEIGLGNIIVVVGMSGFLSLVGLGMIDKNKKKSVLS